MGEQAASAPDDRAHDAGASILRFPSNRPDDAPEDDETSPRMSNVLGAVLRHERHRQQRTLADVAAHAAVSLPYLSEIERGRKEVSSELLAAIGGALDLPLIEIFERSAERLRVDVRMSVPSTTTRMPRAPDFRLAA